MKTSSDPFTITNPDHQASFRNGRWETVLLEEGDRIYRMYTPLENTVTESPFWFDEQTYQRLKQVVGNEFIAQLATRALMAVRFDWSSQMSRLVTAVVNKPFQAAYGPIKFQNWSDTNSKVTFMGGANQLYILSSDKVNIIIVSDTDIRPEANVATKLKL